MRLIPIHKLTSLLFALLLTATAPAQQTTAPATGGAAMAPANRISAANRPTAPLKIKLPFPAGKSYKVIQGNHGDFTHTGFNEYAWDFGLPANTPVCAAASGRVVRVKQDGITGGPSNEYFNDGNTVIIDHGNGYYSQYLHLAPMSSLVKEGDLVSGSQIIARSGNTGFSSTPHLHFHVQDATGKSVPVRFLDVEGNGIPAVGNTVTSDNDGNGIAQYAGESFLPPEVFSNNSISLVTRNLPGHLYRSGQEYRVRGRLNTSDARKIAIYFMSSTGGQALYTVYAGTDKYGFFDASFNPSMVKVADKQWNSNTSQSNMFSLAMAPVKGDGSFWSDVSVPVCIR